MNVYPLVKPFLFALDPEKAHHVALKLLKLSPKLFLPKVVQKPCEHMGLQFSNAVGLAAGFDKNAEYVHQLKKLGFGFIEVGTITPKPQLGNEQPRLFRLPKNKALINRMGFNNHGMDVVASRLEKLPYEGVLGINIGKNASTPIEEAYTDYLKCMTRLYPYASYFTINISSPNTTNLRQLQQEDHLKQLLSSLKDKQIQLSSTHGLNVPLVVKLAPDLSEPEIEGLAGVFNEMKVNGVIATNTTISKEDLVVEYSTQEKGGVSGAPLLTPANTVLGHFHQRLHQDITRIASGGVMSKEAAQEKQQLGADLVQIYTGMIYRGPHIIQQVATSV